MFSIIHDAGWPIWFLILCSFAAIAFIVERFLSLQPRKVIPPKTLEEAISVSARRVPPPDVIQKLAASSVLGAVLANGLQAVQFNPKITAEELQSCMESAGRQAVQVLERFLPALSTIATVAPLLGLFGTVIGMIEIFGAQQAAGQGDPTQVAHGISVALYNTAFGLIIAVGSMLFYRYLRARVEKYILVIERSAERFSWHLMSLVERAK